MAPFPFKSVFSTFIPTSKRARDPQTSTKTRSHPAKRKKGGWGDGGGKSVASEWPASPSHVPLIGILVEFSHIASMIWAKRALFYYWGFTRPKKKKKIRHAYSTSPTPRKNMFFIKFFFFFFLSAPIEVSARALRNQAGGEGVGADRKKTCFSWALGM